MKAFDLSVTICSWNTLEDTRLCLSSLAAVRDEANFEVIVSENASADGSAEMIGSEFPWVKLLRHPQNLGFTGGHNAALKEAQGRHQMLLNSDTLVHPGALKSLVKAADELTDTGIIGAKLLNPDGSLQYSCRRFPNPVAALFRNTPLGKLFPKNRFTRDYLMSDWDHSQPSSVDWVSGAALVICERALPQLKGLDPDFFMYCEDVDICWRCHDLGLKVMYTPDAVITHKIGGSTSQVANRMIVRFHKSMLMFYRKHQLGRVALPLRPIAYLAACCMISLRAFLFLSKNWVDHVRRKLLR